MATRTARAHVEKALRATLRINASDARLMMSGVLNERNIDAVRVDLRDCFAVVNEDRDVEICILTPEHGILRVIDLRAGAYDLRRWETLSLVEAYELPPRVSAVLAEEARARIAAEQHAEHGTDLDAVFGPVPEIPAYEWRDGKILSVEVFSDHAQVRAEIDDEISTYGMIPLFGTPEDLGSYARGRIGVAARLCVESPNPVHVQRGVPEGMPVIEMVIPQSETASIARSLRRAA